MLNSLIANVSINEQKNIFKCFNDRAVLAHGRQAK